MDGTWNAIIWHQFGAAIAMLENALRACPDELWRERLYTERPEESKYAEFWYVGFHALFWLDFYLSDPVEGFATPAPFTLSELEAGMLPERVYTKEELQTYLEHGRSKCRARLETLTEAMLMDLTRIRPDWPDMTVAGLLLYNMRHVQDHAAQLNLFLGQKMGSAPRWVAKAGNMGVGS
jgi:hypothetical protein